MPYGYSSGAPSYQLVTPAAEQPVTLVELKAWLKITGATEDDLLNSIIAAVTKNAELYTKREFIVKEFKTYRDFFGESTEDNKGGDYLNLCGGSVIELRRTPTDSITSVKYIDGDGVLTTVASTVYYFTITDGSGFSLLTPNPSQSWPADLLSGRLQAVEIIFKAGLADAATFKATWPDLYQALFSHMASVYTNRGDCSISEGCKCSSAPTEATSVYDQYRIIDFASAY